MKTQVADLAYKGQWKELLKVLRNQPFLVNEASESKGYTPLHQAAWHGANPAVIGALLSLGANPTIRTFNKNQTPLEISADKHHDRSDLKFLLNDKGRTAGQLIRKVVAENKEFFENYDGNKVLCDRLIESFGADICSQNDSNFEERLEAAFKAMTGKQWDSSSELKITLGSYFGFNADPIFWNSRFLRAFQDCSIRSQVIPIESHWATVTDLFDPIPEQWGLRGDLFLWMEMRAALNHVPIPEKKGGLKQIISSLFLVLTGTPLSPKVELHIPRFSRGGMSSGMICGEFWHDCFIPMIQQRSIWLKEAWSDSQLAKL